MCMNLLPIRFLDLQRVCTLAMRDAEEKQVQQKDRRSGPWNVYTASIVLSTSGGIWEDKLIVRSQLLGRAQPVVPPNRY